MAKLTRRKFIDISKTAIIGGAALAGTPTLLGGVGSEVKADTSNTSGDQSDEFVIPSYCDVCFMGCGINVTVKNGKAVKIEGNPVHPISQGKLCPRGTGGLGQLYDPDRLKTPLLRVSGDKFKAVSWDEALDYIAKKMKGIISAHGPESMALLKHGKGADQFVELWHQMGSETEGHPSYAQCRGPRDIGWTLTYGKGPGGVERVGLDKADVVAFIGSHLGENMHNATVQEYSLGLQNGARHIVVDPRFSTAASKAKYWLPIAPGTDIALLLAWTHVLIYEDLYDHDFVEQYTTGFDELKAHVAETTPEWAAVYTGLNAEDIRKTAVELGMAVPKSFIFPGRRYAWYGDDTQRARAVAIINGLLGAWGRETGIYLGNSYPVPPYPVPTSHHEAKHALDMKKKYPLGNSTPVQDIIEASIPGKYEGYQNSPIKGWLVYSTNLSRSVPDPSLVEEAAQHLDLLVVVDTMPSEIAGLADVVLPDTTYLERFDVMNAPEWKTPFVSIRQPVVKPLHNSRPSWWIAKSLGERLGYGEAFPYTNFKEVIDYCLGEMGSSLKDINQKGGVLTKPYVKPEMKFRTPSGKVEFYSKRMERAGYDPMPRFSKHNTSPNNKYYRLLYARAPQHTFSRTTNNAMLLEVFPENEVWVHPEVAVFMGLKNGNYTVLRNQRGVTSNPVKVKVTKRIRKDCVFMVHGFGRSDERMTKAYQNGADDNGLLTDYVTDPVMGATGSQVNFVTFT